MADNRSASRQRKTNQNRAARQSLATRRAAAAEKADAKAKAEADADEAVAKALKSQPKSGSKTASKGSAKSNAKPTQARSSLRSRAAVDDDVIEDDEVETRRPNRTTSRARVQDDDVDDRPTRGGRPVRGPSPVPDHEPGIAGFFAGVREVPGGTAVIVSVVLGLVAFVAFTFVLKIPVGPFETIAAGAKGQPLPPKETGAELGGGVAIVFALLPVLVSVVALLYTLRPQRRKVWLICVFVTLAMVTLGAGTAGLPCVIALGWAYYKTSKAEREI